MGCLQVLGSCSTGVGCKHPVIIRREQLRLTSSRLVSLLLLHVGAQYSAGAYTSARIEVRSDPDPGSDLPRQTWVKLNRLHTGVGRSNADMWRWCLSRSPACDCGADQQTANHIITECPLYRPPNGVHGLIDVDADAATREWLLSKFPEI